MEGSKTCMLNDIDRINPNQSLFTNEINAGRQKRQVPGPGFENSSFTAPSFEDLTFTDAQRRICNNMRACLYDLAITGDLEVADVSRETSENTTRLQELIRKQKL